MTFDSEYEPFFQPPGWIVGPVWAVLYTCIAISFFMVLSRRSVINYSNIAIALFLTQLAVNLAWPSVFNDTKYLQSLVMIVVMIVFAIASGDGLLGEIQFMIGSFFLFFIIFWLFIAWIF